MNIIQDIDFGNNHRLQQARHFLEKCSNAVSLHCELTDFLEAIAHHKNETLASARKQFIEGVKKLAELLEVREQSKVMNTQFKEFINKTHILKHQTKESELTTSFTEDDEDDKDNFEEDLTLLYIEAITKRFAEGNEILADVTDLYWDYFPIEVQEYLFMDMEHQVKRNESLSDSIPKLVPEVSDIYAASISRLKNSVFRAKALNQSMPKVRLSELDSRCLSTNTDKQAYFKERYESDTLAADSDTSYTLEELLEGITPENSHEATNWGRPVGNEVW